MFGINTNCSARYNVAAIGPDLQWANTAMYSLLLLWNFCNGSCFGGRCVAGILIVVVFIVVFIVAVLYGNKAFGHSTREQL